MEFRVADSGDIPALCELLGDLFGQEAEFVPNRETQERGLEAIVEHPHVGQIFVAALNGNVVGMVNVLYTVSTALGSRVALMEDMVVSPDARGLGIGSKLVEYAIAAAKAAGCSRIALLTDKENIAAQRFYERHGFVGSPMIPLRLLME